MDELTKRTLYKWNAGGKAPLYLARPGSGKTAFVIDLAKRLGVGIHIINLATFEAVDLNGMPYIDPDTHEINMSKPWFAKDVKSGDIIFMDEVNLAMPECRNGLQTMLLSHTLPTGEPLPKDVKFIGAMNVAEDLDSVMEFSNAMKDRWAFMPFNFPVDEWHKLFLDNFGKPQTDREKTIRAKLSKFLTTNPQLLEGRKPIKASTYGITDSYEATAVEASTPNRRNWDNLARELAQTKDDKELKQMQKQMFIENVGLECWRNYKEYISTESKPLSSYDWDGEPDEISQQVNRLRAETNTDKQVAYFVRAYEKCKNKEIIAALLPDVLRKAIIKYGIEYKTKLPEFYKIYATIGA